MIPYPQQGLGPIPVFTQPVYFNNSLRQPQFTPHVPLVSFPAHMSSVFPLFGRPHTVLLFAPTPFNHPRHFPNIPLHSPVIITPGLTTLSDEDNLCFEIRPVTSKHVAISERLSEITFYNMREPHWYRNLACIRLYNVGIFNHLQNEWTRYYKHLEKLEFRSNLVAQSKNPIPPLPLVQGKQPPR